MVLTRAGLAVAALGLAIVVAGRVFGLLEVTVVGVALVGLVVLSVVHVILRRSSVVARRILRPPRIPAGTSAQVDLQLDNRRRIPSPVLRLTDQIPGTPGATLLVAPLHHRRAATATYRLPPMPRGLIDIGPLEVTIVDTFGLAQRRIARAGVSQLIVHPVVEDVSPPPRPPGSDPHATLSQSATGHAGDEFHALRPYVTGDDLRRVHWPATAHHDELMIRQHDEPWQTRTTVVVDNRESDSDAATFERLLSAAASVLVASHRRGDQVRLAFVDGTVSGFADRDELTDLLDLMAAAERNPAADLRPTINQLRSATGQDLLVGFVAVGTRDPNRAVTELGLGGRDDILVRFHDRLPRASATSSIIDVGDAFVPAWESAVAHAASPGRSRLAVRP